MAQEKKHFSSEQAAALKGAAHAIGYLDPKKSATTVGADGITTYHPDYVKVEAEKFEKITDINPHSEEAKTYAAFREIRQPTYQDDKDGQKIIPDSPFYVYLDAGILGQETDPKTTATQIKNEGLLEKALKIEKT